MSSLPANPSSLTEWVRPGELLNGTHYILRGPTEGQVVVCVHGIGAYHVHFDSLAVVLVEAGFQVLQYDLIGRGYSDQPAEDLVNNGKQNRSPYSTEGHLRQLHDLIAALGLTEKGQTSFHLIGHSMGGAIAAAYAARYPEHVISLVLLAPAGLMDLGPIAVLRSLRCLHGIIRRLLKAGQEGAWREDFVDPKCAAEAEMRAKLLLMHQHNPHAFEAFFQSALHFDFDGLDEVVRSLEGKQIPLYLLWGTKDKAVTFHPSFERWKARQSNNPRFESTVLDGLAHGFFLEKPDEVLPKVREYLIRQRNASTLEV